MTKLGRGRPRKSRLNARSERLVTFLTKREYEALYCIADENGSSLSSVAHRIIAAHLKREKIGNLQD